MEGDQVMITVGKANPDGSVEVSTAPEESDANESPESSSPIPGSSNPALGALAPAGVGGMMSKMGM
jgi:hypothetical protein